MPTTMITSMLTARFIAIPTIIRKGIRITTSIRRPAGSWARRGKQALIPVSLTARVFR